MSPEYAQQGLFSIKSDVFSFGVLLLETLSSKRNTDFSNTDSLTLLGRVSDKISLFLFFSEFFECIKMNLTLIIIEWSYIL